MTIINENYTYAGVSLMTYAYNVRALGTPEDIPARRGSNAVIPGVTGRIFTQKKHDQTEIVLSMFVSDKDPNDPSKRGPEYLINNLDRLKALFSKPGLQPLQKSNGIETRTIMAEVVSAVTFQPITPRHYAFVVTFLAPYPYWTIESGRGLGQFVLGTDSLGTNYEVVTLDYDPAPVAQYPIHNVGTAPSEHIIITITGVATSPKLSIDNVWFQYNGELNAGDILIVNTEDWTATLNDEDVAYLISHGGDPRWLVIPPGDSIITYEASGKLDSEVTLSYRRYYV